MLYIGWNGWLFIIDVGGCVYLFKLLIVLVLFDIDALFELIMRLVKLSCSWCDFICSVVYYGYWFCWLM